MMWRSTWRNPGVKLTLQIHQLWLLRQLPLLGVLYGLVDVANAFMKLLAAQYLIGVSDVYTRHDPKGELVLPLRPLVAVANG